MGALRNSDRLASVHPALAAFVRALAQQSQLDWCVVTGERTQAQQLAKYEQGRTTPGPNAGRPGFPVLGQTITRVRTLDKAPHALRVTPEGLYACAVDLQFVVGHGHLADGRSPEELNVYLLYGKRAEAAGFVWGGRFPDVDLAHIELADWRSYPLPGRTPAVV